MAQFLIEEALLLRVELEGRLEEAREAQQLQSQEAMGGSLKRREQAQLALQRQAAG